MILVFDTLIVTELETLAIGTKMPAPRAGDCVSISRVLVDKDVTYAVRYRWFRSVRVQATPHCVPLWPIRDT